MCRPIVFCGKYVEFRWAVCVIFVFFLVMSIVWTSTSKHTHTHIHAKYTRRWYWFRPPGKYEHIPVRILYGTGYLFYLLNWYHHHSIFSVIFFNRLFICAMLLEKEKEDEIRCLSFKGSKFKRTKRIFLLYLRRHDCQMAKCKQYCLKRWRWWRRRRKIYIRAFEYVGEPIQANCLCVRICFHVAELRRESQRNKKKCMPTINNIITIPTKTRWIKLR